MKMLMKTQATRILAAVLVMAALSSCSNEDNYKGNIAVVDNVPISNELFAKQLDFYQKFYTHTYGEDYLDIEVERGKTNNDILQRELIDSMIKDQVMLNDLNNNKVKIDDSKASSMRHDLENKLGGKDSLKANMNALDLSENQFNENLYVDSIRKIHYDYYLSHNDIKDSEILEYYNDNPKYQKMYKYNVLVFDDLNEANKVKSQISSANDFRNLLKASVKNYDVINSDFVYNDDIILTKSAVTEKDTVSDVFEYDGDYMILMVNSYNENENELLINLKDLYLKENYEDYLNKLVKKSKIRQFS